MVENTESQSNSSENTESTNEKNVSDNKSSYDASNITVLEGLEAVRKRPAMYIGDIGKQGLHHLIFEVLDNSIDEASMGYCDNIEITIHNDESITVTDDGRGIPVETHKTGISALEVVIMKLHAGGKFDKKAYKTSGGLHGVGISVVNALSETMTAIIKRNGRVYSQKYSRGKVLTPVMVLGETNKTGTEITFKPDSEIFTITTIDYAYVREKVREMAFLNKNVRIVLTDERTENGKKQEVFHYTGGITEFVNFINEGKQPVHPIIHDEKNVSDVNIEYAFQYTNAYRSNIHSFVNNIRTTEGGTHIVGFRTALTRVINDYLKNHKLLKPGKRVSGDDAVEGITLLLSVKVFDPQFEGQTKTKLGNSEVKGIVEKFIYESLKRYLEENPNYGKAMCHRIIRAMDAREAAQKARDLIRRKNVLESSVLPGKLADCVDPNPERAEIFIVEGESAGGSSKQGRDRQYQAILPIKGKILNVEKAPINKVLSNEEIKTIITSLGGGFGDNFDLSKLRYNKIVIMTDADVDGSHIQTLLLTLFYRYFKSLVEEGHVYIAQPPLYKIKKGKIVKYAYTEEEKIRIVDEFGGHEEGLAIQRYKGLGEMNPTQLWETTMNPETRTMKKIEIDDAILADQMFTILMGGEVEPRRKFIQQYAREVKNLDI